MNKKIFLVLVAILAVVFIFTGCENYSFGPVAGGNAQAEVVGNGGMTVRQGNYLYFVNGVTTYDGENTFGEVVKGAIMRYQLDTNGNIINLDKPTTVVPKAVFNSNKLAGFYVYGEWIYYVTPSTAQDNDGNVQTNYIEFMRVKIDGTGTEKIITLNGNSTEYAFSDNALLYYANSTLYSVDYKTKESKVISENVVSYVIPRETTYKPADGSAKDADNYVYYTKSSEELSDFNNEVWVASFDGSYNQKMIGKYSYFDAALAEKYENNDMSAGYPDYTKIFAISLLKYENGVLYYSKTISENSSSKNVGVYSYDMNAFIKGNKKFDYTKETTWTTLNAYSTIYATDSADKVIVASSSKLWLIEKGSAPVELFPAVKNVLAVNNGYIYYNTSSANDVYRVKIDSAQNLTENAQKVSVSTPDTSWLPIEFMDGYIYYVQPDYDYVYRINTALDKDDEGYDVKLGIYSDADQEKIDEAEENA